MIRHVSMLESKIIILVTVIDAYIYKSVVLAERWYKTRVLATSRTFNRPKEISLTSPHARRI